MRAGLILFMVLVGSPFLDAARLHHVHSGNTLGENAVMLRSGFTRLTTTGGGYNVFGSEVGYGISEDIDFSLTLPLVSLAGIDNSLVIGDMDFQLLVRGWNWYEDGDAMFSSVWFALNWRAGISVSTGEGKNNPETGTLQYYAPVATGRSAFSIGGGYSFPLAGFSTHINFFYYSETGSSGKPFEFVLVDDHVELAAAIEYYIEGDVRLFGSSVNIGFKPFYEVLGRLAWDHRSPAPSRLENSFGIWLRFGRMFRMVCGVDLPVALEDPRFLKREFFINLAVVFR